MGGRDERGQIDRRSFMGRAGLAGALTGAPALARAAHRSAAIILDPKDPIASAPAVALAAMALKAALGEAGFAAAPDAGAAGLRIRAQGGAGAPEGFTLARDGGEIRVVAADARGLSYGLRELADRLRRAPETALDLAGPASQQPVNPVRCVMRQFTCEAYDKPWFYDREMWPAYLSMLADNRFNRLHLAFGLGYDALAHVADPYLLFTYPYLIDVPGYGVSVSGLSAAERDRNLDALKFIARQTVAHGLDFQLGLWMHGYQWPAAPGVAQIEGLTPQTHADYCRDAMAMLLKELPEVSSVALRIHGESGVKEGSYGFWKTVFAGVAAAGRPVEIDLHAKGVDQAMIDNALAVGMPVNVSPKYWGEHLGMAYHQAAIREYDMPAPGQVGKGLMTLSEGARSFTRYGYADLLREDRRYTVRHRVFPGAQHLLASRADPAHGLMFGFCGSTGADLMEPLTYRGRRGTHSGTDRSGYRARRLQARWDWLKYADWYRSYGRTLYDPRIVEAPADTRERALDAASHVLPMVTTAYAASAACDAYWPEAYWNQPLAGEPTPNPYADNLAPKVFDNASPFDPQLFSSMREHAAELLGEASGKVSPIQVATWLEDLSREAKTGLAEAGAARSIDQARLDLDIALQAELAAFFAAKFRAGVLYALMGQTHDGRAGRAALIQYRRARAAWARIVARADGAYGDLSCSDIFTERGAWADRVAALDADIGAVAAQAAQVADGQDPVTARAIAAALSRPRPAPAPMTHEPVSQYRPGQDLALSFAATTPLSGAVLWWRPVSQAERWRSLPLARTGYVWSAGLAAADTAGSAYPLQYYVQGRTAAGRAFLYPGLTARPTGLPYFVLRQG